jgi:hypothetical protein
LIEAAYVELALAANRDLFDEALPLDFSEQAYHRLKRHKVPFAGAIMVLCVSQVFVNVCQFGCVVASRVLVWCSFRAAVALRATAPNIWLVA